MTAMHRISGRNVLIIEIWNFDIVWNLSIVIWDFSALSGKANRFQVNQSKLTLTLPCLAFQGGLLLFGYLRQKLIPALGTNAMTKFIFRIVHYILLNCQP